MNPYEVLGINDQADKAQIKRAYFRLLREHSPEKDPEGFARIREAYERLTNEKEDSAGPDLPIPDYPYAEKFVKQVEQCIRDGRWELAKETAEEGWRRFDGSVYFLYRMTCAQRLCGNTGKAVKNAELLVKKDPENRWFWRELALARLERGYTKKAYRAFQKAYELGCRDYDFLLMYSVECREYPDYRKGKEIIQTFLEDPDRRWRPEDMDNAVEAHQALFFFTEALDEPAEEAAQKFSRFLERNKRQLTDCFEHCLDLLTSMLEYKIEDDTFNRCVQILKEVSEKTDNPERSIMYETFFGTVGIIRMNKDEKVCRSLRYMNELLSMEEFQDRYSMTDCRLCIIQEREQVLESEEYIADKYPEFYGKVKPFLDKIRTQRDMESVRYRLLQDYRKLMESNEEGSYLQWFPEQREAVFGKSVVSSEETYVRAGKKISRNDPCPCGSGKKYKFCCGRR